ncbi:MAG: nitronate monooxygenase [Deltaproteobacteria bacterium]|nr:nitronate monooxygenase [Deltaproteobacteria bacterium]
MNSSAAAFMHRLGLQVPIICGAMYPCSNPELIAAVSQAGGIGIVQPLSLVYVYGYEFRAGLQKIRSLTSKPIGMNVIVEKGSKVYEQRMREWVQIALEEGIRFFITALGNPAWVVEMVRAEGGFVFHNTTEKKWAEKALASGVEGFVCVNDRAGGHAGACSAKKLYEDLSPFGLPLVCAGGVGGPKEFVQALDLGYAAVQMGTRFIASVECKAHSSYKQAIINADESQIVLTKRVTGVPLSVIRTPYVDKVGTEAGALVQLLLRLPRTRHAMRMLINLQSVWKLKRSALQGLSSKDYWQAGKSVSEIDKVESVPEIIKAFQAAIGHP